MRGLRCLRICSINQTIRHVGLWSTAAVGVDRGVGHSSERGCNGVWGTPAVVVAMVLGHSEKFEVRPECGTLQRRD